MQTPTSLLAKPSLAYQDDYVLALNKPAGMDVEMLQSWVKENFTRNLGYSFAISNSRELRNGLVHRLDKPTSGVILFAKSAQAFSDLQKQFADRQIEKVYQALVHGSLSEKEGIINAPVGRLPWKRTKFGVYPEGREAVTNYKILAIYDIQDTTYSLLELYPKTGRTHQLRVHLKHIGHSIVSDPLYAGRKTLRADLKTWPRLWLHAKSIEFTHPVTKNKLKLEAPLPSDLKLPLTSK